MDGWVRDGWMGGGVGRRGCGLWVFGKDGCGVIRVGGGVIWFWFLASARLSGSSFSGWWSIGSG